MKLPLLLSLLTCAAATGWAVRLLLSSRDRRLLLPVLLTVLLGSGPLYLLLAPAAYAAVRSAAPWGAALWLALSACTLAMLVALEHLLTDRRRMRAALRESRRTYATLLRNLPGMAYRRHHDAGWTMTFVSEGCRDLTGYAPDDLLPAGTVSMARLVHPEDRAWVYREIEAAVAGRRPYHLTYRFFAADGTLRWAWEQGRAVTRDGKRRLEGLLIDISDLKRYEAELVEARHKAEEMNRLKSAFLTNISHEIRTPLTSVIGFATILAEEVNEDQRELVEHIEQSGQRLLDTLNAMIDLSLIESGNLEVRPVQLNLCHITEAVVDRMFSRATAKGLHLRFEADAPVIWAQADQVYLERALQTLIDNGIKFTERGHVTVGVHQTEDQVSIRVSDTGIGIGEAFLPHLFDAFKQESTGATRAYEGVGLGLTLTKKLVELLGGAIEVESRKGQGTTFTIVFPRLQTQQGLRIVKQRRRNPGSASGLSGRASVLVIDPAPSGVASLQELLEPWCDVFTVASREAALQLIALRPFEVILLNVDHQDSAGLEMMEQLRAALGAHPITVVALTSRPQAGEQGVFLDAGFDGYVGLPGAQIAIARMVRGRPR